MQVGDSMRTFENKYICTKRTFEKKYILTMGNCSVEHISNIYYGISENEETHSGVQMHIEDFVYILFYFIYLL